MPRQLEVLLVCGAVIAAGRLIASFDGPFVLLGGAVGSAGFVGIIVWVRRQYQKERSKPPWPPEDPG